MHVRRPRRDAWWMRLGSPKALLRTAYSVMSAPTAEDRHGARPPAVSMATFFGGLVTSVS